MSLLPNTKRTKRSSIILAYSNSSNFSFASDPTKQIVQRQSGHYRDNEHDDIEPSIKNEEFTVLRDLFQGYLDGKEVKEKSLCNVYPEQRMHLSHTKLFADVTVKPTSTGTCNMFTTQTIKPTFF